MHTETSARPRILIVDDDPALTTTLTKVLSSEDFEVEAANRAHEALELARQEQPSLAIVDLHMPDMDGYAFIDAFRTIVGCEDVPVFLATGAREATIVRARSVDRGVVLILPKPFDLETLVAAMRGAIHSHSRGGS